MKTWQSILGFNPEKHSVRTEFIAGVTTFLTMSYILAVNPDILAAAGMDKGAVFTATALSSAVATLLIAFLAKLPFAQAPSMGINAFFAFTLVQGMGYSWQTALAAVFVEGIVFILLTAFNIREKIVDCIPYNLRYAISAGIGMFIAFIGLKNAGIIVSHPATLVALGPFTPIFLLAILGIILSAALVVRKVRGALFYSIAICTIVGIPLGVTAIPEGFAPISSPQSLSPTFLQMDFAPLLSFDMAMTIFALVFMDIFNTIGTLIGAAAKTEMMDEKGNVKNIKQAMMADAIGTSLGAILGTSTVTTYVESGSGIAEGGRTGLTALVTGSFFLLALFLSPLFLLVPGAATTGALVMVGVFMLGSISMIDLSDLSETFPVFITLLTMVLTYSIAEGMALGMLAFVFVKLLSGQYRSISLPLYILAVLFILRYAFA
ncbi:NCS2 family permease [Porphyromonas gingivalis]|uniref:Xanthine/uracil permease family protein n=1 Tax=Porphyromonas gingivalis (strain ATCC BAA-308 / W83) TaxID=242619 RepID=Q7MVU7_PORGI|nr:NCS2 family permease [Porphyromonas gingivalis]AAQ66070.1 xanthine/uracil permease family protein [Porphyromonas gingivalis W83]AKV64241.1 permease [Porphyromonas gingivalis]ALA93548.1 permease [Porphyromonas gingivalis AJW4]ATR89916.1 NCS2 family permease [Porphyromonas gingivalis]ATR93624.1 NCS2 family permease [Porphyromonas gingivalis]